MEKIDPIKDKRDSRAAGLTQDQLAAKAGVTQSSVSLYFKGVQNVGYQTINKIRWAYRELTKGQE